MADARTTARTNMYVAAMLYGNGRSSLAKIRNMSATGALVDASLGARAGCPVRLTRGSLAAEGTVAWALQGRCGIRFDSVIEVREWLAPPANREQSRVDDAVSLLRAGAIPLQRAQRDEAARNTGVELGPSVSLGSDLKEICLLLEALGAELTDDPDAVLRHGGKLQWLDIAVQSLKAITDAQGNEGPGRDELIGRLDNLRASRSQALRA